MLDFFNFANPQTFNYQEFHTTWRTNTTGETWVKPRGVSMVRFLLIGSGGGTANVPTSSGIGGGGSGAVTSWIGPAIFVPDVLRIAVGLGGITSTTGTATSIIWQETSTTGYTLLTANPGNSSLGTGFGNGGAATAASAFAACGIYKSIAGQNGAAAGAGIAASGTTFLSGGAGGSKTSGSSGGNVPSKYGYPNLAGGASAAAGGKGSNGYFTTQPLLLGTGGSGGGWGTSVSLLGGQGGNGAIGCGGGSSGWGAQGFSQLGSNGGNGAVYIWSW